MRRLALLFLLLGTRLACAQDIDDKGMAGVSIVDPCPAGAVLSQGFGGVVARGRR